MASAAEHAQTGMQALQRGELVPARAAFEAAMAAGARDAATYLGLALACDGGGDAKAALAALDTALVGEPRNLRVLILRGDISDRLGDTRAAGPFYSLALGVARGVANLPHDVVAGLTRAQAALQRYAALYQASLTGALDKAGFTDPPGGETSRFGQSLDLMFGKKKIFLQEPKYYFFPGLPQLQFYPRSDFPWLDPIEAATDDIRGELMAVLTDESALMPYVEANPGRPYSDQAGMLGNPDWSAFYLIKFGEVQQANAARCPKTMAAIAHAPLPPIEGQMPSVLFSVLKPKAKIPPHHGFVNTRLICHLPLIVPEGCSFRVGNETRPWREGKAWVFDDTIEHEAWNRSDQTRAVLLFDIWRPELSAREREAVTALFNAIRRYGAQTEQWGI